MFRKFLSLLVALLLLPCALAGAESLMLREADAGRFASNPRGVKDIGDPFILVEGDYHLFATGGPLGFFHWQSGDLTTFERTKALTKSPWAQGDYWAPEVYP